MRKLSEMALLRTTDCAVLFPLLPPFFVLIDNIQIFALENEILLASCGDAVSMVHLQIKCEREAVLTRTCIHAFVLYGYTVSEAMLESVGNGSPQPVPMPSLPGVFIRCELTPCGPLVTTPRTLRVGQGWPGRR
jgi:hypothetical protein